MLIIGGLFVVALVAVVLAVFLAREDSSTPDAQKAVAPEKEAAQAIAPVSEVGTAAARAETKAPAQEASVAPVAQVEQSRERNTGVIQPAFNEIVFPLEDGKPSESLIQAQGQLQELTSLVRQLQEQIHILEERMNHVSEQVEHIGQNDEHESTTFVDIPVLPRSRHP